MPPIVWSMLGINGLLWGFVLLVDDGDVPVGIALMVSGAVFMLVYARTWRRKTP